MMNTTPTPEDAHPRNDGPLARLQFTRRDFLRQTSAAAGALAVAPMLGLPGLAPTKSPAPGDAPTSADPLSGGSLDTFILDHMRRAHVPSLAGATVRGADLEWSNGYGWANIEEGILSTPGTVYMLASISKTFICGALMQLWEAGSVDLDADVNTYLPFEIHNPAFPDKIITPRMLLTHTSSIRDRYTLWGGLTNPTPGGYSHGDATIPLADILAGYLVPGGPYYMANENYYDERPGSRYHYSNIGADVAAYVVEVVSGTLFSEYCKTHLFAPLGMTDTGHHLADITTPNLAMPYRYRHDAGVYTPYYQFGYPDYPCGALRTTANSLSKWLRCFMNFGELDGARILERTTVEEIFRPQIPGTWWQGLIWYYRNHRGEVQVGHNGSDYGVSTSMFFGVDTGTGAITLTNRYVYGWKAWYALRYIDNRLFAEA